MYRSRTSRFFAEMINEWVIGPRRRAVFRPRSSVAPIVHLLSDSQLIQVKGGACAAQ